MWVACFPLLAAVVSEKRSGRAFLLGYLSGAVYFAGSCYWFVGVMERYGRLSLPLAVGVLILFLAADSCFFGVFCLIEAWVARESRPLALLLSPFLWVSMELGRTYLMTGFPWNLLGYAVHPIGIRRLASVTAVYGLSFLAVATSALLAWVFLFDGNRWARVGLVFWLALLLFANWISIPKLLPNAPNVAALVQPNVPLGEAALEDWAPWRNPGPLERLVTMTVSAFRPGWETSGAPSLVIWPENPAPFYFDRDPVFRTAVQKMARETHAYVVVGTVTYVGQDEQRPKNSAVVLDPHGNLVFQYDKINLVPFGEYVPGWAFPGRVGKITSEVGNFVPGSSYRVAETPQGRVGIFICYESIFPQLARRLASAGAGVLVNISNDAWFGDSSAALQHLEMARLRAIENGRFLLRATNDGITAVIDPFGRVTEQLPRHQPMVLLGHFSYQAGRTFYTAHGDVFAWMCVIVTVGIVTLGAVKGRMIVHDRKRGMKNRE